MLISKNPLFPSYQMLDFSSSVNTLSGFFWSIGSLKFILVVFLMKVEINRISFYWSNFSFVLQEITRYFHRTACLILWPDGDPSTSLLDHCYQLVFFLVTYVLPMLGLSITYCHLGTVLWTQEKPNPCTPRVVDISKELSKNNKIKDKRKVETSERVITRCLIVLFRRSASCSLWCW